MLNTKDTSSWVDLHWLPLGAGGTCVRSSSRLFEVVLAGREQRDRFDLYHSALEVQLNGDRFVIEMAPEWGNRQRRRGVVGWGPVGVWWLGRSRYFRYEVRRWRDGVIPDVDEAVATVRVSADEDKARCLLRLVPEFPRATWGRDELDTGDMWNSNSLVAWLLARSGHETAGVRPPDGGRAPGWDAGLIVAAREALAVAVPAVPGMAPQLVGVGGGNAMVPAPVHQPHS